MDKLFDLSGKSVVITGGGGILCGKMAMELAKRGAKIAVTDLNQEAAEKVADAVKAAGGTAIALACNVLEKESIESANEAVLKEFGSVDILINGAGGNHPKGTSSLEYLTPDELDNDSSEATSFYDLDPKGVGFTLNLNFLGTFIPTQVFSKSMAKNGSGVIINISSMSAFTALTKVPAYSAAKAAVSNFTGWLAVHLAKVGVRVNAIAPGFFLTDQNRALLTNEDGSMTARGNKIISNTPMERYGDPEDLIGTLVWLVSDQAAGFVTGTVIPVDGGFNAFAGV